MATSAPSSPSAPDRGSNDDRGHSPDRTGATGSEPDYRFTLANERTFLAWIRTALALIAGAVAVLHLVPLEWGQVPRLTVGLALTALAVVITVYAPVRWLRVQRAMRHGLPLSVSALPLITTAGVALVCVAVLAGNYWP